MEDYIKIVIVKSWWNEQGLENLSLKNESREKNKQTNKKKDLRHKS